MRVNDADHQATEETVNLVFCNKDDAGPRVHDLIRNSDFHSSVITASIRRISMESFSPMDSIIEETMVDVKPTLDARRGLLTGFVPYLRSGEWCDIGGRAFMEDAHICIDDMAKSFGSNTLKNDIVSFYGVFDGHEGNAAAHFVRDHLPRIIAEDLEFPLELEKVVTRSFVKADVAFKMSCSLESALSSGTTALTAIIFRRLLVVANAGDCRAVLSHTGVAVEMSKEHRPCCSKERRRVESLGGYIDSGYLNGQLGVTRALGDWHLEGMKGTYGLDDGLVLCGPLTSEPELRLRTLGEEDEFLLIGSDGIWDVFSSQNAVDFARRQLLEHNCTDLCCREMVEEAARRGATDNLTVVMVCFHRGPPVRSEVGSRRSRVRRCISAEGLQSLKCYLER